MLRWHECAEILPQRITQRAAHVSLFKNGYDTLVFLSADKPRLKHAFSAWSDKLISQLHAHLLNKQVANRFIKIKFFVISML